MLATKPVMTSKKVESKCGESHYSVDHVDVNTSSFSQSKNVIFSQISHVYSQTKPSSQRTVVYANLVEAFFREEKMTLQEKEIAF